MKYFVTVGNEEFVVVISQEGEVTVNGVRRSVDMQSIDNTSLHSLIVDRMSHDVFIDGDDDAFVVDTRDGVFGVNVQTERSRRRGRSRKKPDKGQGEQLVKAPMPGMVVEVPVCEGQALEKGDVVVVLESMKMQNELKTPELGTIKSLNVNVGDRVEQNQVLAVIS